MRGMNRLRQAGRWLSRYRLGPRAMILMYHRVTDLPNDPNLLSVSPQRFAEHMELIRRHYSPIPLQQLVQGLRHGKVPNRAVVVTFDDGYADNLYCAKPVLERYEIPATVFVTASHVGSNREFWWDELDRLLLQPGTLPERVRLDLNGGVIECDLGESARYTKEDYERHRNWHLERKDDPSPRHALFRMGVKRLSTLSSTEKGKVLDDLLSWSGAAPVVRSSHHSLTGADVNLLNQSDLLEVGAHTMTHPMLSSLPPAEQLSEIKQSKDLLAGIINTPVTSFAYPHGSYARETLALFERPDFLSRARPRMAQSGEAIIRFDCLASGFAITMEKHFPVRLTGGMVADCSVL